jgi:hypothetical protein
VPVGNWASHPCVVAIRVQCGARGSLLDLARRNRTEADVILLVSG